MGVDEAGGDEGVGVLDHRGAGGQAGQQVGSRAHGLDTAVCDQQQAVGVIFVGGVQPDLGRVGEAVEQGGAVGDGSHGDLG